MEIIELKKHPLAVHNWYFSGFQIPNVIFNFVSSKKVETLRFLKTWRPLAFQCQILEQCMDKLKEAKTPSRKVRLKQMVERV